MQEELEHKSIALSIQSGKITSRVLAKAMVAALRKMKDAQNAPKVGKQSLKQLAKGGTLSSVEITDENIKAFDPIARKYGIGYSLKRDDSIEPPRWNVFFRAKDVDAMTAAFKEFSAKTLAKEKGKSSVKEAVKEHREQAKNAVKVQVKRRGRGVPEL